MMRNDSLRKFLQPLAECNGGLWYNETTLQNGGTPMAFGETLANLRKTKGLSQEQLAEKLNLTRQTISKWELNQSTPDLHYLVQLSNFFCVSTDYLIKGEQTNYTPNSGIIGFKSYDTENIENNSNGINVYKWCFYLGAIVMAVSLVGIIAFVVCSALNPHIAIVNNAVYNGIFGFLVGTKTLWFFILLIVLLIAGCLSSTYGIIKCMRK